jgi:hypothetical protein
MRLFCFTLLLLIGPLALLAQDHVLVVPANCGGNITHTATTAGDDCALRPGNDYLYQVVLPYNATWTFSVCNATIPANYDSYLYLTDALCGGTTLAFNDDACGLSSRIIYTGGPDTLYLAMEQYANNANTYTYTLSVSSGTPPVSVACPPADTSLTGVLSDYTALGTVTGGFPPYTLVQSPAPGTPLVAGNTLVQLLVTDSCGVANNCAFNVGFFPCVNGLLAAPGFYDSSTVNQQNTCALRPSKDFTVQVDIPCDGNWIFETCGGNTDFDTWIHLGTTCCSADLGSNDDNCGLQSRITANGLTAGTYFLTVEGYANAGAGNFTLHVYEDEAPVVVCPPFLLPDPSGVFLDYTAQVAVTDNCPAGLTVIQSPAPGTPLAPLFNAVTITAVDASGNSASCMFNLGECLDGAIEALSCGPASLPLTTYQDNCPFRNGPDFTVAVVLPHLGNWTFTNCGTTAFDSYMYLSSGCCSGLIQSNDDACGVQSRINWTGGPDTVYVTMEAYNQQDPYSCVLYVYETSPVAVACPGTQVLNTCLMPDFTALATVTDPCPASLAQTPAPGTPLPTGDSTLVTIVATDVSGVEGTCTFWAVAPPAPEVEIEGDSLICVFETAELGFSGTPVFFSWSNGATTNPIEVGTGLYYLVVVDANQCIGLDSFMVAQYPSPVPQIQQTGGTLYEVNGPFSTYQWYLEGSLIAGATDSAYTPTASGFYQVEVTDTNGCPGLTVGFPFLYIVGLEEHSDGKPQPQAWPNPTDGLLYLRGFPSDRPLLVLDATGRTVRTLPVGDGALGRLDLKGLSPGIYVLSCGEAKVKVVLRGGE